MPEARSDPVLWTPKLLLAMTLEKQDRKMKVSFPFEAQGETSEILRMRRWTVLLPWSSDGSSGFRLAAPGSASPVPDTGTNGSHTGMRWPPKGQEAGELCP